MGKRRNTAIAAPPLEPFCFASIFLFDLFINRDGQETMRRRNWQHTFRGMYEGGLATSLGRDEFERILAGGFPGALMEDDEFEPSLGSSGSLTSPLGSPLRTTADPWGSPTATDRIDGLNLLALSSPLAVPRFGRPIPNRRGCLPTHPHTGSRGSTRRCSTGPRRRRRTRGTWATPRTHPRPRCPSSRPAATARRPGCVGPA